MNDIRHLHDFRPSQISSITELKCKPDTVLGANILNPFGVLTMIRFRKGIKHDCFALVSAFFQQFRWRNALPLKRTRMQKGRNRNSSVPSRFTNEPFRGNQQPERFSKASLPNSPTAMRSENRLKKSGVTRFATSVNFPHCMVQLPANTSCRNKRKNARTISQEDWTPLLKMNKKPSTFTCVRPRKRQT